MPRTVLQPDRNAFDISELEESIGELDVYADPWLLFWEHHFQHMTPSSTGRPYDNGNFKTGSIRYKPDVIRVPTSAYLMVFETKEFNRGEPPRGSVLIEELVVSPLDELTLDEVQRDGFDDKEDMLYQMTQMEGRYYTDLRPDSLVTYYSHSMLRAWPDRFAALYAKRHPTWQGLVERDTTGWTQRV